MALNALDKRTQDVVTASYALPDLETAVQQAIYNAVDAHAKSIKLSVDVKKASFTVVDDGDGIHPDNLYKYVGEHYATSRLPTAGSEQKQKPYGHRGAFLYELISLATTVEVESRVREHWASYRKVFQDGKVVFNARSKVLREAPGTTITVSNLFSKLPVRAKDLSRNFNHQTRVIRKIHDFCVSMSMIWPSLSFDIRFQDKAKPVIIPSAKSCHERFLEHFGPLLGNELQYVSYQSETTQFSIRGYFAFIPSGSEGLGQGIKQAKTYYQFTFLENEWVEECHQVCSRAITSAALELSSSIPIFVLKVEIPSDQFDASGIGMKEHLLFKAPDQFQRFLYEFVQNLAATEAKKAEAQVCYTSQVISIEEENDENRFSELCCSPLSPPCPVVSPDARSILDLYRTDRDDIWHQDLLIQGEVMDSEHHSMRSSAYQELTLMKDVTTCHACGCVTNPRNFDQKRIEFDDDVLDLYRDSNADGSVFSNVTEDESDLKDIFFSNEQSASSVIPQDFCIPQEAATCTPWLSSKPDTYDFADIMVKMSDESHCNSEQRSPLPTRTVEDSIESSVDQIVAAKQPRDFNHLCAVRDPVRSEFFAVERPTMSTLKRCLRSKVEVSPMKDLAAGLQIDSVQLYKGDQEMKISRSDLAKLQVIRQVDRKFILVRAPTSRGNVVLCIDQHAADERVRLENLEEELFGHDGSLRRVEIEYHEPAFVVQVNFKENQVLNQYGDFIKSWGFHFEFVASEPEKMAFKCQNSRYGEDSRILLHSTPKVEKRVANVDDFRDFIHLLVSLGEIRPHSQFRPPVITRLLHSRACRSAIMFGDRLSLAQCRDLIEDLKNCQLPFQCAHGRPSVVPLAEIRNKGN